MLCTAVQVCVDIFQERGHQADVKNQLSVEQLHGIVGNYDGMVIRSATKVQRMEYTSTPVGFLLLLREERGCLCISCVLCIYVCALSACHDYRV